jgi:dipeptidyl-peptidase 4
MRHRGAIVERLIIRMGVDEQEPWRNGHRDRLRSDIVSHPIDSNVPTEGIDPTASAGVHPRPEVDAYPEQTANTLRFTLGIPKGFAIDPSGQRVLYIRSNGARDKVGRLRLLDLATGEDRELVDPLALLASGEELSIEERARRERMRESSAGITSFVIDAAGDRACFALSGQLFVCDVRTGQTEQWLTEGSVIDPRLSPDGTSVAYANTAGEFRVTTGAIDRPLCTPDGENVSWGVAEFVAAEEMNRLRGFWWAPDSTSLLVARVDESPVPIWHISDPAYPDRPSREIRYPAAGTTNADVRLFAIDLASAKKVEIQWDRTAFEYLITVHWSGFGPALLQVMSRDQRAAKILAVDPENLSTRVIADQQDDQWIDVIAGTPAWGPSGQLVTTKDVGHTRHLAIDGAEVTPEGIQVSAIVDIDRHGITFQATTEPTESHLWWFGWGGELEPLTTKPGVHAGRANNHTLVTISRQLDRYGVDVNVQRDGVTTPISSLHETPQLPARVELLNLGTRALRSALILPNSWQPGDGPLPLLVDSYAGPHAQRVVASRNAYAEPQWFAEQGFAVLVVDGRGTPNRGPQWEREIYCDLATSVLEDQIAAVEELIRLRPELVNPAKIAIKGWSFGGYLAALAALRRPDFFAAAVAGAPVTDWSLYDTFYTERYLTPAAMSEIYTRSSILNESPKIKRPIFIIHGLVDDNVVVAHALRLSKRLLETGHPHRVLPLTGITHMPSQEDVARNMLGLIIEFLRESLELTQK